MLDGRYIELDSGLYKPTNITGAPACMTSRFPIFCSGLMGKNMENPQILHKSRHHWAHPTSTQFQNQVNGARFHQVVFRHLMFVLQFLPCKNQFLLIHGDTPPCFPAASWHFRCCPPFLPARPILETLQKTSTSNLDVGNFHIIGTIRLIQGEGIS